jgi:hypothetical protein
MGWIGSSTAGSFSEGDAGERLDTDDGYSTGTGRWKLTCGRAATHAMSCGEATSRRSRVVAGRWEPVHESATMGIGRGEDTGRRWERRQGAVH